ncbi:hypothetical protein D9619_011238 [Psilocybe cf. subviscida]|uniref:Uncharacterized protein n=1 Tax=Psilocybe cf. subviscida TaxID=2480587 RepID=A0A8H5BKN3_9AGAR|nr:hypothetical protein D9619_011238 [Psilocybe cf. subviscida]
MTAPPWPLRVNLDEDMEEADHDIPSARWEPGREEEEEAEEQKRVDIEDDDEAVKASPRSKSTKMWTSKTLEHEDESLFKGKFGGDDVPLETSPKKKT